MVGPVALDDDNRAREATQLAKLLAAQAACPEAQEVRKLAREWPAELKPGDRAIYIAGPDHDLPGALCRDTMDGTTLLQQVFLQNPMREKAIKEVHEQAHTGSKGTYKALRRTWLVLQQDAGGGGRLRARLSACRASKAKPRLGWWRKATTGAGKPASCSRPCLWTSSS
jgi:hypothetical protein